MSSDKNPEIFFALQFIDKIVAVFAGSHKIPDAIYVEIYAMQRKKEEYF